MKYILASLIALTLCFSGVTGCQTKPQTIVFQTASTVATVIPVCMDAWEVAVKNGKTTPAQELQVKAAYEKYQAVFAIACDAGAAYAATSITNATAGQQLQAAVTQAISNASQSLADLQNLIRSFGVTF